VFFFLASFFDFLVGKNSKKSVTKNRQNIHTRHFIKHPILNFVCFIRGCFQKLCDSWGIVERAPIKNQALGHFYNIGSIKKHVVRPFFQLLETERLLAQLQFL
jgi:hypothetical protein